MPQNDISYNFDPSSLLAAFKQVQKGAEGLEKGVVGAGDSMGAAMTNLYDKLVKTTDKAAQAQNRYVKSIEATAAAYGKSGVDKLIAQRDNIIKQLGNEEKQIKRVTDAYARMIEVEKKRGGGHDSGSGTFLAIRGVKDMFEGRTAYGEVMLGRALSTLSGAPLVIGAAAVALGALTVAGYESARSLAAIGVELNDVSKRTGLSIAEVNQFSFAAEVTGQKVEVFERMMRGLTQAVEDQSTAGDKARKWLLQFGVDLRGVRDGSVSTAQVMQQVSAGISALPNQFEKNKAALDLFKRVGIETIPVMMELDKNVQTAKEHGFGPDASEVAQFLELNRQLTIMDKHWDDIKRNFKEGLVISVKFVGNAVKWLLDNTPGGNDGHVIDDAFEKRTALADEIRQSKVGAAGLEKNLLLGNQPTSETAKLAKQRMLILAGLKPSDAYDEKHTPEVDDALQRAEMLHQALRTLAVGNASEQKKIARDTADNAVANYERTLGVEYRLHEAEKALGKLPVPQVGVSSVEDVRSYQSAQRLVDQRKEEVKVAHEQKSVEEAIARIRIDAAEKAAHPYGMLGAEKELLGLQKMPTVTAKQIEEARKALAPVLADEQNKRAETAATAVRQQQITTARELLHIRQEAHGDLSVHDLGRDGIEASDIEKSINDQYALRVRNAAAERSFEVQTINERQVDLRDEAAQTERGLSLLKAYDAEQLQNAKSRVEREVQIADLHDKDHEQTVRFNEQMSKIAAANKTADITHAADLAVKRTELSFHGDNPIQLIAEESRIRRQEARDIYDVEEARIKVQEKGHTAEISHAQALRKLHDDDGKAQEEAEVKLAELQRHRIDEIKSQVEGLYHTLFTDPTKFGAQLGTTLRNAVLKPIENGLSEITAKALSPLIFGENGLGGIAGTLSGVFGGTSNNPVVASVNTLTGALNTNTAALYSMAGSSGGYGLGGFSGGSTGGPLASYFGGGGGSSSSSNGSSAGSSSSILPGYDGGFSPMSGGSSSAFGSSGSPGGTPGFLGPVGGGSGIGGSLGTGGFKNMFGNLRGTVANLKGLAGFGQVSTDSDGGRWATVGNESVNIDSTGGKLKAFGKSDLAKAGAMAGGMALAQAGLLGNSRGTGLGVLEGALGGAAIGFAVGGPIGAAIGAAVGTGIGIGEMIAGVESQRNEAKRLVKQQYHIDINNNMADQIVKIAQSSYGGRVSIAVRSPEVRQMLGLYAAGTNQAGAFPQSASTPHGASLVESGGRLQQQSLYQYGNPYAYQSSLPVYGGVSGGTYASNNGPTYMSFNVGGKSTGDYLDGQFFQPDQVSSKYSAAMRSSNGRVDNSMLMNQAGSIVS